MKYEDVKEDFAHFRQEIDQFCGKYSGKYSISLKSNDKFYTGNWPKSLKVEMELTFDD